MKKIVLSIFMLVFMNLCVMAQNYPDIRYRNIKVRDNIAYNQTTHEWSYTVNKKNSLYFTKVKGFGSTFDYLDPNKNFAFTTDCEYEFIYNGHLFGYSNKDLRFYEIEYENGKIYKRILEKEEVQNLLPNYTIISISDFSKNTNSYKLKKHFGELKIFIYNDTSKSLEGYKFASGNSKIQKFNLTGFLHVDKSGMIEFSANGVYSSEKPCYVILVR